MKEPTPMHKQALDYLERLRDLCKRSEAVADKAASTAVKAQRALTAQRSNGNGSH